MSDETILSIAFFALIGVVFISYTAYQIFDRWMDFKERQLEDQSNESER